MPSLSSTFSLVRSFVLSIDRVTAAEGGEGTLGGTAFVGGEEQIVERRKRMFVGICCRKGPPPLITPHDKRTFIITAKIFQGWKKIPGIFRKRDGELISSPTPPSCENPFISGVQKKMMSPRFSLVFHHITQQGGDGWEEGCCFFHTTIRSYISTPYPIQAQTQQQLDGIFVSLLLTLLI